MYIELKLRNFSDSLLIVLTISYYKIFRLVRLMSLVSHKKSYLVCVELTNFQIFTQPIPNFFSKYKTETANRGQRQLLENK